MPLPSANNKKMALCRFVWVNIIINSKCHFAARLWRGQERSEKSVTSIIPRVVRFLTFTRLRRRPPEAEAGAGKSGSRHRRPYGKMTTLCFFVQALINSILQSSPAGTPSEQYSILASLQRSTTPILPLLHHSNTPLLQFFTNSLIQ